MLVFNANCVVIKVGSSTLTYSTGMLNLRKLEDLVKCIADLKNSGKRIVLVSSGSVAAGFAKMSFRHIKLKQRKNKPQQLSDSASLCRCIARCLQPTDIRWRKYF